MLALFMSGRRDEALDAYEQASHVLDKEYGTQPGMELKTMLARVRDGVEIATIPLTKPVARYRRQTGKVGSANRPAPAYHVKRK
jgi:DNA-binding SARP family transcriptional activator